MRRIALRILVASVAASALVGIVILLAGEFGEVQIKILLTTLCVSGASILAMACAPAWERRLLVWIPPTAMVLSILGMALYVLFMWAEIDDSVVPWKIASTLVVLGVAGAHASLLGLAEPAPQHRWARVAGWAANGLVAFLVLVAMWGEVSSEGFWRALGASSILLAAFTILVAVFQRMAPRAGAKAASPTGPAGPEVRHCPACGAPLAAPGDGTCPTCHAAFRVTFGA